MADNPMSDSTAARTLLQSNMNALRSDVDALKSQQIQFWQFMFGQVPNCKEIKPTDTSWCGQISEAVKNLQRTGWFLIGTFLGLGLIDNRESLISILKMLSGK